MKIYRGIFDIAPENIDLYHPGGGYFGDGTYYSLDESLAKEYCLDFSKFGVIYEAEVDESNILVLDSSKIEGLSSRYNHNDSVYIENIGNINKEDISENAKDLGYDSVLFLGNITGGSQLLILNSNPKIQLLSYQLIIEESNPLFFEELDWTAYKTYYISKKINLLDK